ncbi:hypothetical protein GCM10010458_24840 [Microbacterium luteolum]|uniref:DUF998 domain-containing protein n=1 Tax=Microbacterium luteolum TaxID=69367 RepID=A0ABY7XSP2_MICLT|nr:DUF998 domain-containing protein [Microbacterium luteolum]WDM45119.1 DUF998 domain-containing protein [Microbacterium luteolum]
MPTTPTSSAPTSSLVRALAGVVGSILVAVALTIIWVARLSVDRVLYVSGLGADGEPTARWFEVALLLLVAGGFSVAWAARGMRSTARLLALWTPALSVAIASSLFLIASQVPCTTGCPLPVGPTFTWQDLIHTSVAVLAFAFAAVAMLQTSFVKGRATLRALSMIAGISTAVIAAAGGILSLLQFRTDIGSILELVATTVGMGWLAILGLATAHAHRAATARSRDGVRAPERVAARPMAPTRTAPTGSLVTVRG